MQTASQGSHLFPLMDGYDLTQLLCVGSHSLVYKGIRLSDKQPVVLKMLQGDTPSFQDHLRLRNHYILTKSLNLSGVVKPLELVPHGNGSVLVMCDDGCRSLRDEVIANSLTLADFLAIALQLADILDGLYQYRIVHKDIKPSNILIHPTTGQVKLTDFGLASQLP